MVLEAEQVVAPKEVPVVVTAGEPESEPGIVPGLLDPGPPVVEGPVMAPAKVEEALGAVRRSTRVKKPVLRYVPGSWGEGGIAGLDVRPGVLLPHAVPAWGQDGWVLGDDRGLLQRGALGGDPWELRWCQVPVDPWRPLGAMSLQPAASRL